MRKEAIDIILVDLKSPKEGLHFGFSIFRLFLLW